jgi:hypothetical protein
MLSVAVVTCAGRVPWRRRPCRGACPRARRPADALARAFACLDARTVDVDAHCDESITGGTVPAPELKCRARGGGLVTVNGPEEDPSVDRLDQLFARSKWEIEAHTRRAGRHRDRPLLHRRSRTAACRTAAVARERVPNRLRGSRHPRARRRRRAAPRGPGAASVAHARWTDRRLGRRRDHEKVLRRADGRRRLRPSGVVTRPTVRSTTASVSRPDPLQSALLAAAVPRLRNRHYRPDVQALEDEDVMETRQS